MSWHLLAHSLVGGTGVGRTPLVYIPFLFLYLAGTPSFADHEKNQVNLSHVGTIDFDQLRKPPAEIVTPEEACGLATLVISYLQLREDKRGYCNSMELKNTCQDIASILKGPSQPPSPDDVRELNRKKVIALSKTYDCLRDMYDANLNYIVKQREFLIEKKDEIVEAGCETVGEMMQSGKGSDNSLYPGVDFENACLAVFRGSNSRLAACFKMGSDFCRILAGKIHFEDLIRPGIFEAAVAKGIPENLPEYMKGRLEGGAQVLLEKSAKKLNKIASKALEGKGAIAMAAITAATKQIYMTIDRGGNEWSQCGGTGNMGVCFYKTFIKDFPESHPFEKPETINGVTKTNCCYCQMELWADGGPLNQIFLRRKDDYLAPIESGPFEKTLCHEQEGTSHNKLLSTSGGKPVYFIYRNCQKGRVTGNSCVLGASKDPIEIVFEPKPKVKSKDLPMDGPHERANANKPKKLYAPGARPSDPPQLRERFHELFEFPALPMENSPIAQLSSPKLPDRRLTVPRPAIVNPTGTTTPTPPLAVTTATPRPTTHNPPAAEIRVTSHTPEVLRPQPPKVLSDDIPQQEVVAATPPPEQRKRPESAFGIPPSHEHTHTGTTQSPPVTQSQKVERKEPVYASSQSPHIPVVDNSTQAPAAPTVYNPPAPCSCAIEADSTQRFGLCVVRRNQLVTTWTLRYTNDLTCSDSCRIQGCPISDYCSCTQEAWPLQYHPRRHALFCVLKRAGQPLLYLPSSPNDPGCGYGCGILRGDARSDACRYRTYN
jgi:hypothetical protein